MFPKYDLDVARRDKERLLTSAATVSMMLRAICNAEEYVDGAEAYCKELAAHLKFVEKNVDWAKCVSIQKYLSSWMGKRHEYRIQILDVPVIHGEGRRSSAKVQNVFTFDANNPKKATVCFLDQLSFIQPRFIEFDRNCTQNIKRYVNKIPLYWVDSIGNYRLLDVVNAMCDQASEGNHHYFFRDVERI